MLSTLSHGVYSKVLRVQLDLWVYPEGRSTQIEILWVRFNCRQAGSSGMARTRRWCCNLDRLFYYYSWNRCCTSHHFAHAAVYVTSLASPFITTDPQGKGVHRRHPPFIHSNWTELPPLLLCVIVGGRPTYCAHKSFSNSWTECRWVKLLHILILSSIIHEAH